MTVIDADAHVVECERTWSYMEGADRQSRPASVSVPSPDGGKTEYWAIDHRLIDKGPVARDDVTRAQQQMQDVAGRLRHMDQLGTDIQVLYPTVFLSPVTTRPEIEGALYRSYNRWLADIWREGENRLRWAVMAPVSSMVDAIQELRFGKDNGACAVFLRGIEGTMGATDPRLFPLYEAAVALDLPVCFHAAAGSFDLFDLLPQDRGIWRFKIPGIVAFHSLLVSGLPKKFPDLRFGFVELSSQWVPYAVNDYARRMEKRGVAVDKQTVMESNRFFVACQTDDDLPYVLSYAGEGQLIMGTDYGHFDTASELEALRRLKNIPGVTAVTAQKILDDNPRALYCLS